MTDINKRMEPILYALKDNNDWFYDKPNDKDLIERSAKFAAMYMVLAPKWLLLNKAAIEMREIIGELIAKSIEQQNEIARLKRILEDNDINANKENA